MKWPDAIRLPQVGCTFRETVLHRTLEMRCILGLTPDRPPPLRPLPEIWQRMQDSLLEAVTDKSVAVLADDREPGKAWVVSPLATGLHLRQALLEEKAVWLQRSDP